MKYTKPISALLPALLVMAAVVAGNGQPAAHSQETGGIEIPWRTDWEAARDEARKNGKPLFVVFRCER